MLQTPPTILAINPGTKYLAVAVFQGNQLKDWRIKALKGKWSEDKMAKALAVISSLIARFKPDTLCLKRLHPSRSSPALNALTAEILRLALAEHLWLYRYSVNELEADLCAEGKRNKKNLAEAVAARFPELYRELGIEKSRQNPYHTRMFEAVALGIVCTKHQCGTLELIGRPGTNGSQPPTKI